MRELSIGNESSPEYALTTVRSIRIDPAGSMYVAHPQDGTVRVFDADGQFQRYIGRRGEGPQTGEWLVLGKDGTPVARVSGPVELQAHAVDANHVWGVELNEYDVPSGVRYRIVR